MSHLFICMIRIWSPKSTKWNGVRCSYSDALLNKISTAVERIAQIHLPLFASLEESHCLLVNWTVRAKRYREPNKDSLDLRDVNVWVQLTDRAVSWDCRCTESQKSTESQLKDRAVQLVHFNWVVKRQMQKRWNGGDCLNCGTLLLTWPCNSNSMHLELA